MSQNLGMSGARERVLVAMSGGVDSSVAAALLLEQGHDLVGVTLHLWDAEGESKVGRCCAPEDRDDARRSCEALGIPHYVIDEREAFRETVVDPFVRAYREGTTPSPCVACNQQVKLGRLAELATSLGCPWIATGHYARIERDADGSPVLLRGRDRGKDQSYFLHGVPSSILARMLLPLGELEKAQTRREGERLGVPNWAKKDSQELCFVPDGDIGGFVGRQTVTSHGLSSQSVTSQSATSPSGGTAAGRIVESSGAVLGEHAGVHHFTVGQRRGLGLGGGPPRYVLRILPATQEVIVGGDADLLAEEVRVERVSWLGPAQREPFQAAVQIRYRHTAAPALVIPTGRGFVARFEAPQRAVAPGQAAVVFLGERVLGGGTITARPESPLPETAPS